MAVFNGDRVSVSEDEKVQEMDDGDGCTTVWISLMPLNYALKNDSNSKFCYAYFTIKNYREAIDLY